MEAEKANLAEVRNVMVKTQLRARGITDEKVLKAFREIPREIFIPPDRMYEAYEDRPVPIGYGQTISQPYVVALMVQALHPQPHHRILDVGAGSGYQTAILARLVKHVYAVERIEQLTEQAMASLAWLNFENVTVWTGDGTLGYSTEAPFDGIICGAAAPEVPQAWIKQLTEGGRIVMPVGGPDYQVLVSTQKKGDKIIKHEYCDVRFVRLIGKEGWPS